MLKSIVSALSQRLPVKQITGNPTLHCTLVSALSQRLPVKQITGNPTLHCTQNLYKHSAVNESKSSCNFSQSSVANMAADTTKQEQNNSNCAAVRANTSSKAF